MIFDAVLFFNELDLLEIRLETLKGLVDKFIISEATITFSGKPKPLYFSENKSRFAKFEHQIIHQVIDDTPEDFLNLPEIPGADSIKKRAHLQVHDFIQKATNFPKDLLHFGRDFYQRECLRRAMADCRDDDIILFSDVDEIPKPETLRKILKTFPHEQIFTMVQSEFNYFLNAIRHDRWLGPRVANYKTLRNLSLNEIRAIIGPGKTMVDTIDILDGGWHFTSLGSAEKIKEKIESWGHQEFNTKHIKGNIEKNISAGRDIFERPGLPPLQTVPITADFLPQYVVNNQERYQHFFRPQLAKPTLLSRLKEIFG